MAKKTDVPFAPPQWPATMVKMWKLKDIKPYPQNARHHPPEQIKRLAKDMLPPPNGFGVTTAILVDEQGVILYGHGRRLAAIENQFEEYPVHQAIGWTEEMKRAARIADNKRGMESEWNPDLLRIELQGLKDVGFDIKTLGFSNSELAAIIGRNPGSVPPDETPPVPDKPFVQPGDVWVCGRHRLVCGDATDPETVKTALGKDTPMLMVTDAPYGVNYDADWRNKASRSSPGMNRTVGATSIGKVSNDDRADWRAAFELFPGDVIYAWHAGKHGATVQRALEACKFEVAYQVIWAKPVHVIGRGDYHWQHEPCFYAVREGKTHRWNGSRKETTLWHIENMHRTQGNVDDGKTNHSTQKPVECMKRPIENNSKTGEAVYDPFMGSGTTMIACEMTGRNSIGIELNPAYVQMAVERWARFTKETPTLNGVPFDQVKRERGNAKGRSGKPVPSGNAGRTGKASGLRKSGAKGLRASA